MEEHLLSIPLVQFAGHPIELGADLIQREHRQGRQRFLAVGLCLPLCQFFIQLTDLRQLLLAPRSVRLLQTCCFLCLHFFCSSM